MSGSLYFKDIKLPHRANHYFHLIHESKLGKLYYIHTSGVVCVRYKNGKERKLEGFVKDDDLYVKIENKAVKVKSLVAREMCPKYNSQQYSVVLKDGNPKNCDWYNIEIFTKQELGKKTGILAGKNKKVSINGKVYESVRVAAKELFVSYQTLLDYLSGKVNKSVIPKNIKIKYCEDKNYESN